MAKRSSAAQPPGGEERKLHCKRQDRIEFPVPADHELARFQTLTPVRSAEHVQDFLGLWAQMAEAKGESLPTAEEIAGRLKKQKVSVLRVAATSLRIPDRAVLTLNNPLNHIECDEVTIAGDLVLHGDLVLRCNTLTIE